MMLVVVVVLSLPIATRAVSTLLVTRLETAALALDSFNQLLDEIVVRNDAVALGWINDGHKEFELYDALPQSTNYNYLNTLITISRAQEIGRLILWRDELSSRLASSTKVASVTSNESTSSSSSAAASTSSPSRSPASTGRYSFRRWLKWYLFGGVLDEGEHFARDWLLAALRIHSTQRHFIDFMYEIIGKAHVECTQNNN